MNLSRFQLDEADVLAVIEGGPIAPEREARVRHAMRVDPAFAAGVAAMQSQRAALAALADAQAPADLLQRVGAQLEREEVLGLTEPSAPLQLPVSQVQPRRRSVFVAVIASPWSRRLAVAAGVAVVAGASIMLARPLFSRPVKPTNVPELARDTTPGTSDVTPPRHAPALPERLASRDHPLPVTPDKGVPTPTVPEAPPAVPVVASIEQPEIGIAEALKLAREGRLAVRIAAKDAEHAVARLETLRGRRTIALGVDRLNDTEGSLLAAALNRDYDRAVAVLTSPKPLPGAPESPTTIAGDKTRGGAPVHRPSTPGAPVIIPPAPQYAPVSFAAQVPLDEASLLALLRTVATGDNTARFIALDRPVETPLPLDHGSVLWWSGPSAGFALRASVPIAVQITP